MSQIINYCILTHENPQQLATLVRAIHDPKRTRCIIHLDKKKHLEQFHINIEGVHFVKNRIDVQWGTYSVVEAVLQCLEYGVNSFDDGYYVLLSGMDLPIRPKEEIISYLNKHNNRIFIKHDSLPSKRLKEGGKDRYEKYWFSLNNRANLVSIRPFNFGIQNIISLYRLAKYNSNLLYKALQYLFTVPLSRKYPNLVYAEMWWAAPNFIVRKLIEYIQINQKHLTCFQHMKIPDESFLQYILLDKIVCNNNITIVNDTLTYIEWSAYRWPRPTTFLAQDLWTIKKVQCDTTYLFARKFDERVDNRVITDVLDTISM